MFCQRGGNRQMCATVAQPAVVQALRSGCATRSVLTSVMQRTVVTGDSSGDGREGATDFIDGAPGEEAEGRARD